MGLIGSSLEDTRDPGDAVRYGNGPRIDQVFVGFPP